MYILFNILLCDDLSPKSIQTAKISFLKIDYFHVDT